MTSSCVFQCIKNNANIIEASRLTLVRTCATSPFLFLFDSMWVEYIHSRFILSIPIPPKAIQFVLCQRMSVFMFRSASPRALSAAYSHLFFSPFSMFQHSQQIFHSTGDFFVVPFFYDVHYQLENADECETM